MAVVFVGAFNPITHDMSKSSSGAGAKVQYEIIRAISNTDPELKSFVLQELRTWPFNSFFIKGKFLDGINFLPMVNFVVLKSILFSLYVFCHLLFSSPSKVYFYNTTPSMNFLMFVLGLVRRNQVKILIIQDLHAPRKLTLNAFWRLDRTIQYLFFKLTRFSFNYFIPITKQLGEHLSFPKDRCYPFLGGVLDGYAGEESDCVKNIAVFAGALEKYNGVDYLLTAWSRLAQPMELHIFGTGSLSEMVTSYSKGNSNIIYHGFQTPNLVKKYIECASINFCFRYSRGLEQEFFFPSKFFDVVSNRGLVVCNRFKNLPEELEASIYFVDDEFSNFNSIIQNLDTLPSFYNERTKIVSNKFSWSCMINSINQVSGV